MDVETRLALIAGPPTEEIITIEELKEWLEHGVRLEHYIGFEISGFVHVGTGLVCGLKLAQIQKAGARVRVFLADYHSWINDKLGGDLETIQRVAREYFAEALKLCIKAVGGNPNAVEFILASEFYEKHPEYWATVLDIARHLSLSRVRRAITILGRKMGEKIDFAKLIYPVMQVADIFTLGVNLPHGGIDQRKAHVIAREVAHKLKRRLRISLRGEEVEVKPVAVHHKLLPGLKLSADLHRKLVEAEERGDKQTVRELLLDAKMSKSVPESCIFVHDPPDVVREKILKAFCPPKETRWNPILAYCELLIFPCDGKLYVERPEKYGGPVEYTSYEQLIRDYREGKLHPLDLKNAVAEWLVRKLEPIYKHFTQGPGRRGLELLSSVRVTR